MKINGLSFTFMALLLAAAAIVLASCRTNRSCSEEYLRTESSYEKAAAETAAFSAWLDSIKSCSLIDIDSIVISFKDEPRTACLNEGSQPMTHPDAATSFPHGKALPSSATIYGIKAQQNTERVTNGVNLSNERDSFNRLTHWTDSASLHEEASHPPDKCNPLRLWYAIPIAFIIFILWLRNKR